MVVRPSLLAAAAALAASSCASPSAGPAREAARAAPASTPAPSAPGLGALPPQRDGAREALDPAAGRQGGGGPAPRLRTEPGDAWAELNDWYAPRKPLPRPPTAVARGRGGDGPRGGEPFVPGGAPPLASEDGDFWADARGRR